MPRHKTNEQFFDEFYELCVQARPDVRNDPVAHPLWVKLHASYKRSYAWTKIKRVQKLEEFGDGMCICGVEGSDVKWNVHHINYDRCGNELMSDLMVVCAGCHYYFHEKKARRNGSRTHIITGERVDMSVMKLVTDAPTRNLAYQYEQLAQKLLYIGRR